MEKSAEEKEHARITIFWIVLIYTVGLGGAFGVKSCEDGGGRGTRISTPGGYGEISDVNGRPKTYWVRPYTRKDGTRVRGHYRSTPPEPR